MLEYANLHTIQHFLFLTYQYILEIFNLSLYGISLFIFILLAFHCGILLLFFRFFLAIFACLFLNMNFRTVMDNLELPSLTPFLSSDHRVKTSAFLVVL